MFVLDIKEKTKLETVCYMDIHIVEIPTNKGANSYKLNISKRDKSVTFGIKLNISKRDKSVTFGMCYMCIHNFEGTYSCSLL